MLSVVGKPAAVGTKRPAPGGAPAASGSGVATHASLPGKVAAGKMAAGMAAAPPQSLIQTVAARAAPAQKRLQHQPSSEGVVQGVGSKSSTAVRVPAAQVYIRVMMAFVPIHWLVEKRKKECWEGASVHCAALEKVCKAAFPLSALNNLNVN